MGVLSATLVVAMLLGISPGAGHLIRLAASGAGSGTLQLRNSAGHAAAVPALAGGTAAAARPAPPATSKPQSARPPGLRDGHRTQTPASDPPSIHVRVGGAIVSVTVEASTDEVSASAHTPAGDMTVHKRTGHTGGRARRAKRILCADLC